MGVGDGGSLSGMEESGRAAECWWVEVWQEEGGDMQANTEGRPP